MTDKLDSKEKESKIPHTFVILFGIIVILAFSTYFIPAGEFDTEEIDGTEVVVPGTYETMDSNPASFIDIFNSVFNGMNEGAEIIFFLLIIGGSLGVLSATGALDNFLNQIITKFEGKEVYLIPILLAFFTISGATFGMSEEAIPYLIIILPILIRIGFDAILIAALPLVGTAIGWAGSITNPFNVGIAQEIADVQLFSGILVRTIFLIILFIIAAAYLMRYARKILNDPEKSLMYGEQNNIEAFSGESETNSLKIRDIIILIIFALTIISIPTTIILFDWFFMEMSATFLIMAIVVGIIAKMNYNKIAESFTQGCSDLMVASLAVGLAYSGITILEDSNVIDSIVFGLTNLVGQFSSNFAAFGMFGAQSAINYIVTSGSGQAALTMPIMAPLSDTLDVTRQTAVLAFQFGDGISNGFTPTNGALMAGLAIAGVSWFKWFRFLWPLMLLLYLAGGLYILVIHMFVWSS